MFIVTGSSGELGSRVVRALCERVGVERVVATCREPERATGARALGVQVRRADYREPDTLREAFDGGSVLLLISSDAARRGENPVAQHATAIEAARAVGLGRVVYTSHVAADERSAFPPMWTHHATERLLAESGLRWTALRNGFYAASGATFVARALESGVLHAPADGPVAWTEHDALAEGAAAVVSGVETFEGPTPPLVGPRSETLQELASRLAGRPIERVIVPDDEFRTRLLESGMPSPVVDITMGFYEASRAGEFEASDPTLQRLGTIPTDAR